MLSEQLAANTSVRVVDAVGATFENGTVEIVTGNPNCLFYDASSDKRVLSNTTNCVSSSVCENLVIKDGYPFESLKAFTATNVSYDREFVPEKWSTLCLPFTVTTTSVPDIEAAYQLTDYDTESGELTFSETTALTSTKPRIVKTRTAQPFLNLNDINCEVKGTTPWMKILEDGGLYFGGTFEERTDLQASIDEYVYGLTENDFKLCGTGSGFKPFRCYLYATPAVLPGVAAPQEFRFNIEGQPTAIQEIQTSNPSTCTVYNLMGMPVRNAVTEEEALQGLPAGTYIVSGRKVIIR